jgi:putative transposase
MPRHIPPPGLPDRRSVRLRTYDYSTAGIYFVTICTQGKRCVFGLVRDDKVALSPIGRIVRECWQAIPQRFAPAELDAFVVMPNHLHGFIILQHSATRAASAVPLRDNSVLAPERRFGALRPGELPTMIRSFKSKATRRVNDLRLLPDGRLWQRGYYEHVVEGNEDLEQLRRYILDNPLSWSLDRENPRHGK